MPQPTWRRLAAMTTAALLLAAAVLAGCSKGASKEKPDIPEPKADPKVDKSKLDKELNVFNWTEYLPEEVLKQFERLYGVKVNYDTYSSNEELHAKLKAGGTGYDVVFPSDYMMQVLTREGLLEKIDRNNITNFSNIDARFLGQVYDPKNEYSVPYMWGTTGIAVNTEKVPAGAIKTWADLWNPEFKGKLVFPDDARETLAAALRANGQSMNATDVKVLEAAKQKAMALKANIKAFNSDSPKDLLLSGEVVAGLVWSGEAAKAIMENDKIQYVLPAEGFTLWQDNMAIPKMAPHKYTAEVFINFLLDPVVSARLSLAYPYGNPNKGAAQYLPQEHLKNPAINPSAEILKKGEFVKDHGDEINQLYDKLWTELKGG